MNNDYKMLIDVLQNSDNNLDDFERKVDLRTKDILKRDELYTKGKKFSEFKTALQDFGINITQRQINYYAELEVMPNGVIVNSRLKHYFFYHELYVRLIESFKSHIEIKDIKQLFNRLEIGCDYEKDDEEGLANLLSLLEEYSVFIPALMKEIVRKLAESEADYEWLEPFILAIAGTGILKAFSQCVEIKEEKNEKE